MITRIIINYGKNKAEYSTLAFASVSSATRRGERIRRGGHSRCTPRLLPLFLKEALCEGDAEMLLVDVLRA